jgi:hypothetical protein
VLEQARRKGGLESVVMNQGHTVTMGLGDEGDDNGCTTYSLGRDNRFLLHWGTTSDEEKERIRTIIIATCASAY